MFERVQRMADAVMLEGYLLYPYRPSSAKNRYRWTFGTLCPQAWSEAGGCEPWWLEAQFLVARDARMGTDERQSEPILSGRLRYLQIEERRIEARVGGATKPVDQLDVNGERHVPWQEGKLREHDFALGIRAGSSFEREFIARSGIDIQGLRERDVVRGRIVRTRAELRGRIRVRVDADGEVLRVTVRVENRSPCAMVNAPREAVLQSACASTHLLFGVRGGRFVSLLDPPTHLKGAASRCRSTHTYPVLAGDPRSDDTILSAPMILHDHPQIAPESPGDFFDATEIDELLALRTMTLTPEEKLLARATDPRSRALVDRVDALDPQAMAGLHGAVRERDHVIRPGSRVRLLEGKSRSDAQDILYAGRTATVHKVLSDVDGRDHLAVTIDGDPAAELHEWYGRFHYYLVDEVELVEAS